MSLADENLKSIQAVGRTKVPLEVHFISGDFDDGDIAEILEALSEYNKACGGPGLEFCSLNPTIVAGHKVRVLAVCPAIPEDES